MQYRGNRTASYFARLPLPVSGGRGESCASSAIQLVEHRLHLAQSMIVTGAGGASYAGLEALDGFRISSGIGESLRAMK